MRSPFLLSLGLGILLAGPSLAEPSANRAARVEVAASITQQLPKECWRLLSKKIPYLYGGSSDIGMDCSASVQRLFRSLGVSLPRTSEGQANALARRGQLWRVGERESEHEVFTRLRPGELLFWVSDADPHRISHVMVFVGYDGKTPQLWGARGRGKTGRFGSGVDYFAHQLKPRGKSRLVAHGRPF